MNNIQLEFVHTSDGSIAFMHSQHVPSRKDLIDYNGKQYVVLDIIWKFPITTTPSIQLIIDEVCS
jgi:hypothetical protein